MDGLLPTAIRSNTEIAPLSQVGSDFDLLARVSADNIDFDIHMAVQSGVSAIVVPGLWNSRDVSRLDVSISSLENDCGLIPGSVGLIPLLDTGKGLWNARDIARSNSRVQGLILGMGDLVFDILKEREAVPFFTGPMPRFPVDEYVWGWLALVAADAGIPLYGLLGTTISSDHEFMNRLRSAADLAKQVGFHGALSLHRDGIEVCNQVFGR
jgi:citrate lyase subunit beta/citryl-CoA lyase